ncbi:protein LTO1 homolog isoform X2 [Pogoniulus pusillus]|uniref:protein LTO1 homolog isoform X2 n=1 Tax=Pogoniulus pusillus TaxID=488313 RepID=UPI0030B9A780
MAGAGSSSDVFDAIVMAEERFHGEGYREGYAEGSHIGVAEGRRYGSLHGAKVGSEIGCYLGFALTWQSLLQKCTDEKNSKKLRALNSLIGMIQKFPYEDPTYEKLQEDMEKIRGKFKQKPCLLPLLPSRLSPSSWRPCLHSWQSYLIPLAQLIKREVELHTGYCCC